MTKFSYRKKRELITFFIYFIQPVLIEVDLMEIIIPKVDILPTIQANVYASCCYSLHKMELMQRSWH